MAMSDSTTTAKAAVVAVERRVRPGLMPSLINSSWTEGQTDSVEGWFVKVKIPEGEFQFSQLDGEEGWTADAFTPAGSSFPVFMNGFGARYLITKKAGESLSSIIDAAVAEVANDG